MPHTCRLRSAQGGLFGVPRSRMAFGSAISWPFFCPNFVQNCEFHFFAQNTKFRDLDTFYLSILFTSTTKHGFQISDENSQMGRTKAQNALHNMFGFRVVKHLSISLALREAFDMDMEVLACPVLRIAIHGIKRGSNKGRLATKARWSSKCRVVLDGWQKNMRPVKHLLHQYSPTLPRWPSLTWKKSRHAGQWNEQMKSWRVILRLLLLLHVCDVPCHKWVSHTQSIIRCGSVVNMSSDELVADAAAINFKDLWRPPSVAVVTNLLLGVCG